MSVSVEIEEWVNTFELIHDVLDSLEGYDVAIRYPGEMATVEDSHEAITAMKEVRRFVRNRLGI